MGHTDAPAGAAALAVRDAESDALIVSLGRCRLQLAEAKTIPATKRIADIAAAGKIYAKRQGLSQECADHAHWLFTVATEQIGAMLAATVAKRATGGDSGGRPPKGGARKEPPSDPTPTLASLGLDKKTSAVAQKLAKLHAEKPALFEQVRDNKKTITAALRHLKETDQAADLARPIETSLPEGIHHGDFRELADKIADHSVDLIFTDPPYDGDSVPLYADAARIAARILKPGASMIAYSGQRHLPEVLASMSEHLRYWWTLAGIHEGGNQILQKLGVRCGWKPLVWFVKDYRGDVQNVLLDVVRGDREKTVHEWQQAQAEALHFIDKLCPAEGVVVDFFLGGATTAVAARKLGRRFIGFEINAASLERGVERLAA